MIFLFLIVWAANRWYYYVSCLVGELLKCWVLFGLPLVGIKLVARLLRVTTRLGLMLPEARGGIVTFGTIYACGLHWRSARRIGPIGTQRC